MKSSNLSARLNPDFNPKNAFLRSCTAKFDERLEIDFFTTTDYLKEVLQFLKSDRNELAFLNITYSVEKFLIKIAQEKQLLNSRDLNPVSLGVWRQILEVVEKNKSVYSWTHVYKNNVLIYKKNYINQLRNKQQNEECATQDLDTLTSDFKEMSLCDKHELKASFKTTMLNTTLKFIKDPSKLTLEYPEMALHQADFMYNLINQSKQEDNVGLGFKSMYSSLHEAIENLSYCYKLKFDILKTSDILTSKLILKKIPKKKKSCNKEINNNNSESKSPTKSQKVASSKEIVVKQLSESFMKKSLDNFLAFIEDEYMASLEFKDVGVLESRFLESIMSISRSENYSSFSADCGVVLKRIARVSRRSAFSLQRCVGKLCRRTETRTITFYKTPSYESQNASVDQKNNKLSKETKLTITLDNRTLNSVRDVKFVQKHIVDENQGFICETTSDIQEKSLKTYLKESRSKVDVQNGEKHVFDAKELGNLTEAKLNVKESKNEEPKKESRESKVVKQTTKESNVTKTTNVDVAKIVVRDEIRNVKPSSKVTASKLSSKSGNLVTKDVVKIQRSDNIFSKPIASLQSAGSLAPSQSEGRAPPPASRQERLIKALSTPVVGGLAERMMRSMGWEGGALGLRGEGIVEPIMPAIHLSPGAGLGHVKAVKQTAPTQLSAAQQFRVKLLREMLLLLQRSPDETVLDFPKEITVKDLGFLKAAVEGCNDRREIGLGIADEVGLVKRIVEEISKHPQLYIGYHTSDDKKVIRLVKVTGPVFVQKPSRKNKKKAAKSVKKSPTDNTIINVENIIDDIDDICPTRKEAETLAYKVKFLEKIKEFLTNKETREAEYKFDCILNKKHKAFIDKAIININRGVSSMKPIYSDMENDLFLDIYKAATGFYVTVIFTSQKFKLLKKFPLKNQINCIKSLPPPKSTDLKNTIIYLPKQDRMMAEHQMATLRKDV